jgi:hypothetical protein
MSHNENRRREEPLWVRAEIAVCTPA